VPIHEEACDLGSYVSVKKVLFFLSRPGSKILQAYLSGYATDTYLPDPLKILPDPVKFLPDPLEFLPDLKRIRYVGASFVAAEMGLADFWTQAIVRDQAYEAKFTD